jgi:hypothetical protein
MFRKLVSNLAFSPALVGQLGFYAKRLRKEEATRRIGLIFTVLALVVQSFAVFSPPEAANASSGNDFINGGFDSKEDYLRNYDQNTHNIKDLFKTLGISRDDIKDAHWSTVNSRDVYSWGLKSRFSKAQGEREYTIKTSSGGVRSYHYRPLDLWDSTSWTKKHGSTYKALVGKTDDGMYFALLTACGNLALKVKPPAPKCPTGQTGTYPNCTTPPKKCTYPGKEDLLASDKNCKPTPKCTILGKTDLDATDARCKPDPIAACTLLKITRLNDKYQLDGSGSVANGATITAYTYVVKRDGKVVDTITQKSAKLTDTAVTTQTVQGTYTVELTITTSLGAKTSASCAKTFTIPAPKMCPVNPKLLESSPECQPCPDDDTLWIKDAACVAELVTSKTAQNTTQGNIDATTTTAKAGDKIVYSLNLNNKGKAAADVTPTEELLDVLEYAQVIDAGGGSFNAESKTLTWPTVSLKAGENQTRMFTVQILNDIPAINTGLSDKQSYDCRIDNTFGNTISIDVECPVQKEVVEQTVEQLPHTGPRENMIFAGVALAVITYFYARSRQMKKEVRLIRRDLNAGTI